MIAFCCGCEKIGRKASRRRVEGGKITSMPASNFCKTFTHKSFEAKKRVAESNVFGTDILEGFFSFLLFLS